MCSSDLGSSKKFVEAQTVDNSYKWAGGGFLSTPSDLVRFALQHLEPGYLSSAALHTLFAAQKTSDGNSTNYGIGWRSGKREDIGQWRGHSGGSVGGTTMLVLVPRHQLAVAVTINNSKGPAKKLAFDIAKHFAAIAPLKEQELPKVDRKSVVEGKSVDLGGRRIIKKKKKKMKTVDTHYISTKK